MNIRSSCLRSLLLADLLFIVAVSPVTAQPGVTGPPVCPARTVANGARTRPPASRPTAESIEATEEAEASDPNVIPATEPPNFGVNRYRLEDYYNCVGSLGCYWTDLDAQLQRSESELDRLLAAHHATTPDAVQAQKLAMVLDIDETALTSYCEEQREDFGYIPSLFEAWIISPEASIPIAGTLRLYNYARAAGVAVFFITGRKGRDTENDQTASTARNLGAAGYKNWQGLLLHDASYNTTDTATFKSKARSGLIARGYTLILNIGDQWSDLRESQSMRGTKAEIGVKLPNPFYYLP